MTNGFAEQALLWVRAFGSDPIVLSTLQSGLQYFSTSFGYIAYRRAGGFDLTLGPPVCAAQDRADMVERFLHAHRRPIFFYVPHDIARLATRLGGRRFRHCGMGIDQLLSLAQPLSADVQVNAATRKAKRAAFALREFDFDRLSAADRERLEQINRHYLEHSRVPGEMRFLNRPLATHGASLGRGFWLTQGSGAEPFGYAVLDPYFSQGQAIGYLLNLVRFEPTRLWGVYYATVAHLAEKLRAEGCQELSLGFCPLTDVSVQGCSRLLAPQVQWLERKLSQVHYFSHLATMKRAFVGHPMQRYFVTPSFDVLTCVISFLRASGVGFVPLLRRVLS